MAKRTRATFRPTLATLATAYADQGTGDAEFVIPENLTELADDAITELHAQAVENFDALYGDGTGLAPDEFASLSALTDGIDALSGEIATREAAFAERAEAAAALAARVRPADDATAALATKGEDDDTKGEDDDAKGEGDDTKGEGDDTKDAEDEESLEAAAAPARRGATRIPLSSVGRRRQSQTRRPSSDGPSIRDHMSITADGLGFSQGEGIDFSDAGEALNARLARFNPRPYEAAAARGQHLRQQAPLLQLARNIPDNLQIRSNDPEHVRSVFERASDESRLPGGSLVASGTGWCAPSTPMYDLIDGGESRDGLLDVPEIGVPRGGISFSKGISFASLFDAIQSGGIGFSFTEDQDVAGEYEPGANPGDPNVVGPKPCYHIECPPFEEYRLDVDGICITAGLLQSKGFPEVIADTVRKVLIAHDHYTNGKMIAQMAAGSTAVTLPATQAGTAAPVLTAIELQVESYRYARRLSRTTTLEAVFPFWIRGAIRSDLSRRLGVDLLSVPDSRIDAWFRERGIAPQFVYNWQALSGTGVTAWPTTVSFLLYAAGSWVRGTSDVITVESLYDSVLLGTNDFTALFTEEGWFTALRGQDSRVVTTSLTADGVTALGQDIAHNGILAAV